MTYISILMSFQMFSFINYGLLQRIYLGYMFVFQNENGATSEKLDFKLAVPCSSYIIPTACSRWVCLAINRHVVLTNVVCSTDKVVH